MVMIFIIPLLRPFLAQPFARLGKNINEYLIGPVFKCVFALLEMRIILFRFFFQQYMIDRPSVSPTIPPVKQ